MMSGRRLAFWGLFVVTLGVYGVIMLWSLPKISAAAGGLAPFDMRPGGYSFDEAKAFVAALTSDGKSFYLGVQHKLDLVYPVLLAATLFFAIAALAPKAMGIWRWVLALIAVPVAVLDWLENGAVSAMLAAGEDGLTPAMVETANLWTVLKSAFTTVAMLVVLLLGLVRIVARMRGGTARGTPVS